MHDGALIDRLIKGLRTARGVSRPAVEKAIGLHLRATDSDEYFASYVSDPRQDGAVRLDIDLREPKPRSGATGGALLVVNVTGGCLPRAALEARYGPLTLSQVPHGHSEDEQSYWTRAEPWGELAFGFAERRPDCLGSVVFTAPDAA